MTIAASDADTVRNIRSSEQVLPQHRSNEQLHWSLEMKSNFSGMPDGSQVDLNAFNSHADLKNTAADSRETLSKQNQTGINKRNDFGHGLRQNQANGDGFRQN